MTFITMYLIATIGINDSKKTLSKGNQNGVMVLCQVLLCLTDML